MLKNLPSDVGDAQVSIPAWGTKTPHAEEPLRPLIATIESLHPLENPSTTTTTTKKYQMTLRKKIPDDTTEIPSVTSETRRSQVKYTLKKHLLERKKFTKKSFGFLRQTCHVSQEIG